MAGSIKRLMIGGVAVAVVSLLCITSGNAQTAPATTQSGTAQKPLMAEEAFKNVQVLRGIPASEFIETMGFFAVSLTANCTTCHGDASAGSWDHYADDTPLKASTRRMVLMVNAINQTNFGGKREVTCFTCHRSDRIPRVTPTIAEVYNSTFNPIEPDKLLTPVPGKMTADQILDRYIKAVGGAANWAKITSYSAKGTSQAYSEDNYAAEMYAKAPAQEALITHTEAGDRTVVFDGTAGWVAMPADDKPIPVLPQIQNDVLGAKLDALLCFPPAIKTALTNWRVVPSITIDDNTIKNKDVDVVQGSLDGGKTPVNLYFDSKTGLLVRQARYNDTKVGLAVTQVDYDDYRLVSGVKIPYKLTVSWLDGQTFYVFTQVQPNVAIDAAKFGKPAPPKPQKTASK